MSSVLRAIGASPQQPVLGARLRAGGVDHVVLAFGALWLIYVVTQFRMPWTPLVYSEEAPTGGIRQLFFTLGVVFAVRRMLFSQTLSQILGMHLGGLMLGILMVSSVLWSNDAVLTIKRSTVYLFGYLLLISLVHVPPRPFLYYMRTVVICMGWIAWISIIAYFVFPKNCTTLSIRPGLAGLTVHPNVFGPCLEMAWGIGLGMPTFTRRQKLHKRFLMVGLILALFMSNSVTALVATLAATAIWFWLTTTSYRAGVTALCGLLLGSVVAFIGPNTIKSFFFEAVGRDASMSGRDTLWADVFREGVKAPIFGGGYGAFWYEGRGRELTGTWNPRQSHNAYLDVFVDLGIAGVLLVLATVHAKIAAAAQRFLGKRGTRQRNAVAAFVSMAIGLCLIGAFGESFLLKLDKFQFFVLFWGVMLLENRDTNGVRAEFDAIDREHPPERDSSRRPLVPAPAG